MPFFLVRPNVLLPRRVFAISTCCAQEFTTMSSDTDENTDTARKPTIITYEGKKYQFTWNQILLFVVAAPVFMLIMYPLLDYAAWIRIIVADNTVSSLNFISAMGATLSYPVNGIQFSTYSALANYVGAGTIFFSYVNTISVL